MLASSYSLQVSSCRTSNIVPRTLTLYFLHFPSFKSINFDFFKRKQVRSILCIIALVVSFQAMAQPGKVYASLEEALQSPEKVYRLELRYNGLTQLPATISRFRNLERLDLRGNMLTSLPETFGMLRNLKWLDLGGNKLQSLPETFLMLTNLKVLNLRFNQITELPDNIGALTNLEQLDISGNQLILLPDSFTRLVNLVMLDYSHNPKLILTPSIRAYIRDKNFDKAY